MLSLEFAKAGLKNKTLTDLFPKQKKHDVIKTRKHENYQVNFANTERLKNSSILYMQNQLNNDGG